MTVAVVEVVIRLYSITGFTTLGFSVSVFLLPSDDRAVMTLTWKPALGHVWGWHINIHETASCSYAGLRCRFPCISLTLLSVSFRLCSDCDPHCALGLSIGNQPGSE